MNRIVILVVCTAFFAADAQRGFRTTSTTESTTLRNVAANRSFGFDNETVLIPSVPASNFSLLSLTSGTSNSNSIRRTNNSPGNKPADNSMVVRPRMMANDSFTMNIPSSNSNKTLFENNLTALNQSTGNGNETLKTWASTFNMSSSSLSNNAAGMNFTFSDQGNNRIDNSTGKKPATNYTATKQPVANSSYAFLDLITTRNNNSNNSSSGEFAVVNAMNTSSVTVASDYTVVASSNPTTKAPTLSNNPSTKPSTAASSSTVAPETTNFSYSTTKARASNPSTKAPAPSNPSKPSSATSNPSVKPSVFASNSTAKATASPSSSNPSTKAPTSNPSTKPSTAASNTTEAPETTSPSYPTTKAPASNPSEAATNPTETPETSSSTSTKPSSVASNNPTTKAPPTATATPSPSNPSTKSSTTANNPTTKASTTKAPATTKSPVTSPLPSSKVSTTTMKMTKTPTTKAAALELAVMNEVE